MRERTRLYLSTLALLVLTTATQFQGQAARRARRLRSDTRPQIKNIFWQPNQLQQGSPAFVTIEFQTVPRRVTATWLGKTLLFFHTANPKVWYALAGADIGTDPGSYDLDVHAVMRNGRAAHEVKNIDVGAANFGTGAVDVPEQYVEPNAEQQKQIAGDDALKKKAFAHVGPMPEWSGNFIPPVSAKPTPSFGETRLLNEERTSRHLGTDYPVPEGTPVMAANSGTVVLATSLYYEGNCVIIDHGQKFFTVYMHFKEIEVKTGDHIAKGQKLGLSGATGRVTGPHFHFAAQWDGAYLDPVQLLALTLPKTHAGAERRPAATRKRVRRRR